MYNVPKLLLYVIQIPKQYFFIPTILNMCILLF